ncbi:MAG: hypothetical protein OEZ01_08995 [Candidatus Heimdallarchaeota archaeon]|nr:hypothetical protein [Candidatus Heimdallarchaeota archaeon]MDH5646131.1 hypothetical protein [Candidatus Heimdallarchaeota archaeon]
MEDSDQFSGRMLSETEPSLKFSVCEVCNVNIPNWMESKFIDTIIYVRFTCDDCHQMNIVVSHSDNPIIQENRDSWVEDFISEQRSSGKLTTIDTDIRIDHDFSETSIDEIVEDQIEEDQLNDHRVAIWSTKFIHESLFGADPVNWLDQQGAFAENEIDITIITLSNFYNNNVTNVKLSAIQCLLYLFKKSPIHKNLIINSIKLYVNDTDPLIKEFAEQTLNQLS